MGFFAIFIDNYNTRYLVVENIRKYKHGYCFKGLQDRFELQAVPRQILNTSNNWAEYTELRRNKTVWSETHVHSALICSKSSTYNSGVQ